MNQLFLERKGLLMILLILISARSRAATSARHGLATHPGHHQQLGFVCLQLLGRRGRFRPPREPPFGKTLLREVVSLAVIAEETNRRSTATSKNKNAAGKRIFRELFLAYPSQGINALTAVDRLDRHQHAHLRRDMNHRSASRQARRRLAQSGVEEPFH